MEYVIGGMGNAPANVIEVGLGDVKEGAVFHYMWTGKPTAGQARVLDWLVDYSADFIVYFDSGKVHPAVMQAAKNVIAVDDVVMDTLKNNSDAQLLVLFDTDETGQATEMTQRLVFEADALNMMSLELTNGLIPLWVSHDDLPQDDLLISAPSEAPRKPQDALKRDLGIPTPLFTEEDLGLISMVQLIVTFVDGSMEARAINIPTLQRLLG